MLHTMIGPDDEPKRASILFVCTGNICRSPAAERLISGLGNSQITVSSAGTRAMVGAPISAPMVPLLISAGADPVHFRARQLTESLLRSSTLVLGMTRAHRAEAVGMWPATVRRAFTLLEFARLLTSVDLTHLRGRSVAERLEASVPLAVAQRTPVHSAQPADNDIADPFRQSDREYERAFSQILEAVRTVETLMAGN